MVTIDPAEEAPEGLTGEEFVEWMKKHKKTAPTASVAEEEEVEPIVKPKIKGKQIGQMRAYKGDGKQAGEATEYGGHEEEEEEGYDASADTFESKHPKLAKAVDIGKKVVGVINKKTADYVKDTEDVDRKLKKLQRNKEEEKEEGEEKKKSPKKKFKKGKDIDFDFDDEDEDDEDITALNKSASKQKVLPGNYKSVYQGGKGSVSYESAFKGSLGGGAYQPAYKTTVQTPTLTQPARGRVKEEPAVEEPMQHAPTPKQPAPDRFNIQNWQSMGFPNTLPQSARGNLFRPAPPRPQPTVVPMVRQPYQPHVEPSPAPIKPPVRALIQSMRARAPMLGPMPKIGLNLNTMPQLMKPRPTIIPPRPAPAHGMKSPIPPPVTFFGVNLSEKKKTEPKPITRMGEGYKHVPLVVMNGIYPNVGYNPKTDPITKKSIIPKIQATITPNDFTMFGYKMKNRKL
jgi:hypothetical protein